MAVVGLEETFYNVSENIGVVEVCVVVHQPVSGCPISFPFNVSLYTLDGTAGNRLQKPGADPDRGLWDLKTPLTSSIFMPHEIHKLCTYY